METNKNSIEETQQSAQKCIADLQEIYCGRQSHPVDDPGLIIMYRTLIDAEKVDFKDRIQTRDSILAAVGKTSEDFDLFQIIKHGDHDHEVKVPPDAKIDLGKFDIERFFTKTKTYPFFINKKEYVSPTKTLTVREILVNYAQVNPADKTLAKRDGAGFHEYKDLEEKVSMLDCPRFTLFDNCKTHVS